MPRRGCVLIVDSEPEIADLLVEILTDAGYAALSASDAPSAVWLTINYAPALLLLDMHMPGVAGSELIAQLQGLGVIALPIVLMSTLPGNVERHVAGARGCLLKPFDIDDLLGCVDLYVQPIGIDTAKRMQAAARSGIALRDDN